MKINKKIDFKVLAYILFCLTIGTVSGLSADVYPNKLKNRNSGAAKASSFSDQKWPRICNTEPFLIDESREILLASKSDSSPCLDRSTRNNDTSQQVYFYIPVSFWPNAGGIERCLSKPIYQHAGVRLLHSPAGYHVSMGNFRMPSKRSANDIALKIQKVVRRTFSRCIARVDKKHEGVTIFGRFVVIVLKTDKKGNNKHPDLFRAIHRKITKLILAAGGSQVGFLEFRPHCSIASVVDVSAFGFQQIRNRLLKNLTRPASEVRLVVNPRALQHRISPQIA